jgi:hypothetical protein
MNVLAFRAGLRASAKVALGLTAVGCGGVVGAAADSGAASTADASVPRDASTLREASPLPEAAASVDAAGGVDATACNAPPPSSLLPEGTNPDAAAGIDPATFDCCVASLEALVPADAGDIFEFPDAASPDPQLAACCAVVVVRLDRDYTVAENGDPDAAEATLQQDQTTAAPVRWACCNVANHPDGPTCTPWGPPVPPEMPRGEVA